MYSILAKLSHSLRAKDSIAIFRGLYRVAEGVFFKHQPSPHSWMNRRPLLPAQQEQPQKIQVSKSLQGADQQQEVQGRKWVSLGPKDKELQIMEESKMATSRISRVFEFVKLGSSLLGSSLQAYVVKNIIGGDEKAAYQRAAKSISRELCKIRGAPLKLAQMLSIQEQNLIPTPIRQAFEKARQSAHVMPEKEVTYMLQKNYGLQWHTFFDSFGIKPFAAASIGQVHEASVNGKKVAVKIQYPNVSQSIESDIKNLGLLLKLPGVPAGLYTDRILAKMKEELLEECDYLKEAHKQRLYTEALKLSMQKGAEYYRIPEVNAELTTKQVMVSEFVEGESFPQLETLGYSQEFKDQLGYHIMKLTFREMFQMGIMQSDPNPANFTYDFSQNKLNLLDFGAAHCYARPFLQQYYRIVKGAVQENQQEVWEASISCGFLTGEENKQMREHHIKSIMIVGRPFRSDCFDFGKNNITKEIYNSVPVMLKNRIKPPPEEVYSLHRKLSGSFLACIRLQAKVNCKRIFSQISFDTLIDRLL